MSLESPKYKQAEARLPEQLKPVFQQMVKEYEFLTAIEYGRGYVAYQVLAEMVLAGWRPTGEMDQTSKLNLVENRR